MCDLGSSRLVQVFIVIHLGKFHNLKTVLMQLFPSGNPG